MNLDFRSIFSQSILIIKKNIKEIVILSFVSAFFVFQTSRMVQLIEQVKNIPTVIFALFAAISPLLFIVSLLLFQFIIINKESGLNVSYIKIIQYIFTRLISVSITNILNWTTVFFGILLFIIPGIIWSLTFSQAYLFSLIDGMNPIQSLKTSKISTNKNKRKLFNLYFLFGLIYGLPIELFSILSLPNLVQILFQVFISYLLLINNYVIWKTLKQNMNSQNLA